MGKLSSIQRQVQETIETAIINVEENYISLAAKPLKLAKKLHSLHDKAISNLADTLLNVNKQVGEISLNLIAKVEPEETKTEQAKRTIDSASKKTRRAVSRNAAMAKEAVKSVTS
jgi:hypothetical protein